MKPAFLYLTTVLSFILGLYNSYAQSLSDLDRRHGFKDFRLGDPKSKWISQLTLRSSGTTNTYEYNGYCCKEAFGSSLKEIGVAFDRTDKLKSIFLVFRDPKQGDQLRNFLGTIEQAFGGATGQESNDNTGDITQQWAGKETTLTVYAKYKGADLGGWAIHAIVALREAGSNADF